ncbi:MAG: hypothetical protein KTR32_33075 [Granulosicoccus sp.]|nr:hypothetical protein [Granulosicoccus sp.]
MTEPVTIACIGFWSEYDHAFLEHAQSAHFRTVVVNPFQQLGKTTNPKYLPKPLRTALLKRVATKLIQQHANNYILLQDERLLIDALLNIDQKLSASILMRNSLIESEKVRDRIPAIKQRGYSIWSFDAEDCQRHGFHKYDQFISKIGTYENTPIKIDFGFIGKNKGRKEQLESLRQKLQDMGFRCEIDLRVGARKKGTGKVDLPYAEYLQEICKARCMIDIVQEQQAGITLRPLEAAIYQRKLMTNSIRVKDLSFYNKNNIFVIGHDSWDRLQGFMEMSFVEPGEETLSPYMTEAMLSKVVQESEFEEV